jgi:ElaB/YqjD/DUF883 family membrane-anchored ribosome-binding protein
MAEPVRNDEPLSTMRFPESPSRSADAPGPVPLNNLPEPAGLIPDTLPDRPLGAWPPVDGEERFTRTDRLDNTGERVGSALGAVVNQTRELTDRVQDRVRDMKHRLQVIASRRSADVKDRAAELADEAQHRASQFTDDARHQARRFEFRARLYARNSPFQFIGGAAAAGFVIGFLLRMWRDE